MFEWALAENDNGHAVGEKIVATTNEGCEGGGIAYHHPWIKSSHEMKYLTQNPHCGCDHIEHAEGLKFNVATSGKKIEHLLVDTDICLDV